MVTHPYHWSVGLCVVRTGFYSTFPIFVRSRVSQAAVTNGRFAQNISGDRDAIDTICADVCSSPTSCMLCRFGPGVPHSSLQSTYCPMTTLTWQTCVQARNSSWAWSYETCIRLLPHDLLTPPRFSTVLCGT